MSSRLAGEPSEDEILRHVCAAIRDALGFQNVCAALLERDTGRLVPRAAVGWNLSDPSLMRPLFLETIQPLLDRRYRREGCYLIANDEARLEGAVAGAMRRLEGAYSVVALTEGRLVAFRDAHGFRPLVLGRLAAADPQANAIWFVRPDGYYYSVGAGFTGLSLAERSYFPGLMAGQSVLGSLVISLSTGKRSVIIAEPVRVSGHVIVGVGVSYSVDQLSLEIDEAMQLPSSVVFYALDMSGRASLHRDPALMFEYPSDMGSDTLSAAVPKMLSEPSGTVEYSFREMNRTVFFETSAVLDWVFALGFSGPAT